jgi:hypothetical protein
VTLTEKSEHRIGYLNLQGGQLGCQREATESLKFFHSSRDCYSTAEVELILISSK